MVDLRPLKEDDIYMFHDQEFDCIKVDDVRLAAEWLKKELENTAIGEHSNLIDLSLSKKLVDEAFGEVLKW